MARFKNQVSKGVESETRNHFLETRNQKPETSEAEADGFPVYSKSDMEAVNVAGFKVPYVVREHWKKACRERRIKLSPMLKEILVEEFGLPPGITPEDL